MKSDNKTALKILGGITLACLIAITLFCFAFGAIIISLPDDIEIEDENPDSTDPSSAAGNVVGDIVGTVASTFLLVILGALLIVVGIIFLVVLGIFAGCFACDMKDKPKRGYAIFIAVISIILSIVAIIITAIASPIYLVMLVATLSASIYGILSAKRAKAIKQGANVVEEIPVDDDGVFEPDELDAPANDKE